MPRFNVVNHSHPDVLRKGGAAGTLHHQTDKGLLWTPPSLQRRFYGDGPMETVRGRHTIAGFELQNRSGGVSSLGIGWRLENRSWIAGRYDGTTYTDLTSSFQSATATVTLGVNGADQTGFAIGCVVPFDWVSVNVTTAEVDAGGAVDHGVKYSNVTGTAWADVDSASILTDDFTLTNTVLTNTVKNFVWGKPSLWGKNVSITGLPSAFYWLYITTADKGAGDTAPIATGVEIGVMRAREGIADNDIYASEIDQIDCEYADGLVAYFSTAAAGNSVSALVI